MEDDTLVPYIQTSVDKGIKVQVAQQQSGDAILYIEDPDCCFTIPFCTKDFSIFCDIILGDEKLLNVFDVALDEILANQVLSKHILDYKYKGITYDF